jgi:dTMP kinase
VLGLHEFDVLSLKPDLTLLFDIDARLALGRARQRDTAKSSDENRFELEGLEFHQRVRTGYLEIAGSEPDRFLVIDARGSVAEVHQRVVSEVQRYLETRGAPA